MTQEADRQNRRRDLRSARQGTAFAALGGTLIGALTGLTGSVLVFVQAENSQQAIEKTRQSDVRREAYGEVGRSFLSFKTEILGVRNFIVHDMPLKEREHQFNIKYIPAYAKLQQADMTARLVATEANKKAFRGAIPHREKLKDMIYAAYRSEQLDWDKFPQEFDAALAKYEQVIQAIMDQVDEEVL
ncbi:hypothetical protein [Streptomyces sp. NPDC054952]